MSAIRPQLPQTATPSARPSAASDATRAAQRAFFQAALTGAAPAEAPHARPSAPAVRVTPLQTDAPPPERVLRPGSLLDIKV